MHFSARWFSLIAAFLALANCAHQQRPVLVEKYVINEQGVGLWKFGQTPEQLQATVCPGLQKAGDVYVCQNTVTIDGIPRLVHAKFNTNNQLDTVIVNWIADHGEPDDQKVLVWKKTMMDFFSYVQEHWRGPVSIRFSDQEKVYWTIEDIEGATKNLDAMWHSQKATSTGPIELMPPVQEDASPTMTKATGTRYGICFVHQRREAQLAEQQRTVLVTQSQTSNPSGPAPQIHIRPKDPSISTPLALQKLPGFERLAFGMPKAIAQQAIAQLPVTPKAICQEVKTLMLRCDEFPLMEGVRVVADFEFTAEKQELYGIAIHVAKPDGQKLHERSVRAAVGFLLNWMHQGMGPLDSLEEGRSIPVSTTQEVLDNLQKSPMGAVRLVPHEIHETSLGNSWSMHGDVSKTKAKGYKISFTYRNTPLLSEKEEEK